MSLLVFGEDRVTNFKIAKGQNKKRLDAMTSFLSKSKYSTNKTTYLSWVKYFTEGSRINSPHQLDAFLAYWLNYFMLPSSPEDGMHPFVFPMPVLLA